MAQSILTSFVDWLDRLIGPGFWHILVSATLSCSLSYDSLVKSIDGPRLGLSSFKCSSFHWNNGE
jgi:hypothetical protein